ncbi:juvenile hormone esterase-like isoform X1 [Anastrepha obliqua]|uniref:juvenile hormone esterase-like isoform X1 n=1 Tax=Anastrepha obliqua TaxID=95512 RepID=UPI00240A865B|nr:juvenile hormone esterase-like isoform X1 [Anastrepha obliqua]
MYTRLVTVLIFYLNLKKIKADELEVCMDTLGCIEGTYKPGSEVQQYEAFLGIPYAKPPIGELRFKSPVPVEPWKGKLLAKTLQADCIQKNYFLSPAVVSGEEDCLYLNVYRPALRSADKLPVLFYIHGGGFFTGSPGLLFYGPEYFMDTNETILVIPGYRLGPFGFLSTGDEHMTGNFGLKDQNLALKWVQSHISAFGGDPSRVTIFGHSSGGVLTHLHMLSSASKGLFRNAISISGLAISPFSRPIDSKTQTIKMAVAVGITNASKMSSKELVDALRKIESTKLVEACDALKIWNVYPFINFRPTIEKESWPQPFLTTDIFKLFDNKPPKTVPWISAVLPSKGEGTVLALRLAADPALQAEFNEKFDELFKVILEFPAVGKPEKVNEALQLIVAEYMGGIHELNNDTVTGFLEIFGDANFHYPFYKTMVANVNSGAAAQSPIRLLTFDYRGPYSYSTLFSGTMDNFGTAHIDDTLFLFRAPLIAPKGYLKSSPEVKLVKSYVGLYVEFAKTGNIEIFNEINSCTKDTLAAQGFCDYLSIVQENDLFRANNTWNIKRMKLWESVYKLVY